MKRTETKVFHFKNGLYTLVSVLFNPLDPQKKRHFLQQCDPLQAHR